MIGVPAGIPCQHLTVTPALVPASTTDGNRRTGKPDFESLYHNSNNRTWNLLNTLGKVKRSAEDRVNWRAITRQLLSKKVTHDDDELCVMLPDRIQWNINYRKNTGSVPDPKK